MPSRPPTTALAALLVLVAGCTSSRSQESPPTAPHSTSSVTASSGSTSPGTSSTPSGGPSSTPPSGLARLRGAVLLLGSNPDTANVYDVTTGGAFRPLTRLPSGSRVADVSADAKHLVVTDDARTHADHIDVVRGAELTDLGLGTAFGPSLSAGGALAWVALEGGSPTPGITKPRSFVVGVRDSLQGSSRIVYHSPSSLASPQWVGPHALVVASSDGRRTRLVRVDTATRATRVLADLAGSDDLELTASASFLTAWDGSRATVLSTSGRTVGHVAAGWRPLCWLPTDSVAAFLLVARGGQLARAGVSGGDATPPAPFAYVPQGMSAYAASCTRVVAG